MDKREGEKLKKSDEDQLYRRLVKIDSYRISVECHFMHHLYESFVYFCKSRRLKRTKQ